MQYSSPAVQRVTHVGLLVAAIDDGGGVFVGHNARASLQNCSSTGNTATSGAGFMSHSTNAGGLVGLSVAALNHMHRTYKQAILITFPTCC